MPKRTIKSALRLALSSFRLNSLGRWQPDGLPHSIDPISSLLFSFPRCLCVHVGDIVALNTKHLWNYIPNRTALRVFFGSWNSRKKGSVGFEVLLLDVLRSFKCEGMWVGSPVKSAFTELEQYGLLISALKIIEKESNSLLNSTEALCVNGTLGIDLMCKH